jgi:hypothetical protein
MLKQLFSLALRGARSPHEIIPFTSRNINKLYFPVSIYLNSKLHLGTNIFDIDWDCLIILDTCRPDALKIVANEYKFIDSVESYWSVGGDSWEWMANTFSINYIDTIKKTGLYTSNPNAKTVIEYNLMKNHGGEDVHRRKVKSLRKYGQFELVSAADFADYEYLIRSYDNEFGYPTPRQVTDCAINADRNMNLEKLVLHYMPPHGPYIVDDPGNDFETPNQRPPEFSNSNKDDIWQAYLNNLRWGLNEIELLLENISRKKVVITADHGHCFNNLLPGHFSGQLNPSVRKVPLVRTSACDSGEYVPRYKTKRPDIISPEDTLRALGYT